MPPSTLPPDLLRLRALAVNYKRLVLLVGLEWILAGVTNNQTAAASDPTTRIAMLVGVLATAVLLALYGYRLARSLDLMPIVWAIAMFLPLVNLIALLSLSRKSQAVCRQFGVRVGLLGPNLDDVVRLEKASASVARL